MRSHQNRTKEESGALKDDRDDEESTRVDGHPCRKQ